MAEQKTIKNNAAELRKIKHHIEYESFHKKGHIIIVIK